VGLFGTVQETDDLQWRGIFAEETVKLGIKPDETGFLSLTKWEVAEIFAHCTGRVQEFQPSDYFRMMLLRKWLDSGRTSILFG
jgi:hypothetical protein